MRIISRYLMAGMIVFLMMSLAGCTDEGEPAGAVSEVVELHEPKGVAVSSEPVRRRNLYIATVYEGAVYPYVEEYAFSVNQRFGAYNAVIGDTVQEGDILFTADEEAVLEKLEGLEEKLRDVEEEYTKFKSKKDEELYTQNRDLEQLDIILENLEKEKPEEIVADEEGNPISNPGYAAWQSEYTKWNGERSRKEQDVRVTEEAIRQHTELYELDYSYYDSQIQEIRAQRKDARVASRISGVVVNMGYLMKGQPLIQGENVMAVADTEQKYIKCDSVPRRLVINAVDMYAFAKGKRYEISYVEGDNRSSTFTFSGGEDELEVGDYAVVVVKSDYRENVLTIPADSLSREGTEQIVYVLEEGRSVVRTVETGMNDGVYAEVLSGLEEGELVVCQASKKGTKEAVLERKDREVAYTGTGYAILPVTTLIENPIEDGDVVIEKTLLPGSGHVEKGEALAAITVETDEMDIITRENTLKRARERLADLEAEEREENEETIAARKESIAKQEEELAKLKKNAATTEICSTVDGFLEYYEVKDGQLLEKDAVVAVVADESFSCLAVDISQNRKLNYGDELAFFYKDSNNADQKAQCRVLTLGACGRDCYMGKDVALVSVPQEVIADFTSPDEKGYGSQHRMYRPTGFVNKMENVVMVPAEAVIVQSGRTYVEVMGEDGESMRVAFLAGGSDKKYYWVLEGLTEGMKICWE